VAGIRYPLADTNKPLIEAMIKFFRKVRQKLVNENKFSKYLLYAIGEIILVVIGILIAINLNNSNQQKVLKEGVNNQLSLLKQSVYKDSLSFQALRDYSVKQITASERLVQLINEPISEKSCEEFITKFKNHIEIRTNIVDRSIYDEMVSSAAFSKIDKQQLKSQIATYYQLAGHFQDVIWLHAEDFREFNNHLFMNGVIARYYFDENASISMQERCNYIKSVIDNKEKKQMLENYFYSGRDTYNIINGLYLELLNGVIAGLPEKPIKQ
jgi:hypothetical protein